MTTALQHQAQDEEAKAERWVSLSFACRRLGISRHAAYRWIAAGHFRHGTRQTITGRWQISPDALVRVEQEMRRRAYDSGANGASGSGVDAGLASSS